MTSYHWSCVFYMYVMHRHVFDLDGLNQWLLVWLNNVHKIDSLQNFLRTWLKNTWWLSSPFDVIKWLGLIDMMLICVSVTDVELQEFYLASSPPPDSFLLVKYTHTVHHFTQLHTITVHFHSTPQSLIPHNFTPSTFTYNDTLQH